MLQILEKKNIIVNYWYDSFELFNLHSKSEVGIYKRKILREKVRKRAFDKEKELTFKEK